jgi:hypothetical protein
MNHRMPTTVDAPKTIKSWATFFKKDCSDNPIENDTFHVIFFHVQEKATFSQDAYNVLCMLKRSHYKYT